MLAGLGARVADLLRDQGISQARLATVTELTPAAISQICAGLRTPSAKTLQRLASALGVTVDYLLCGNTDNNVTPEISSLLQAFSRLNPEMKQTAIHIVRALYENEKYWG